MHPVSQSMKFRLILSSLLKSRSLFLIGQISDIFFPLAN